MAKEFRKFKSLKRDGKRLLKDNKPRERKQSRLDEEEQRYLDLQAEEQTD